MSHKLADGGAAWLGSILRWPCVPADARRVAGRARLARLRARGGSGIVTSTLHRRRNSYGDNVQPALLSPLASRRANVLRSRLDIAQRLGNSVTEGTTPRSDAELADMHGTPAPHRVPCGGIRRAASTVAGASTALARAPSSYRQGSASYGSAYSSSTCSMAATKVGHPATKSGLGAAPALRKISGNEACWLVRVDARPSLDYTGPMQVVVHLHAELARLAPDNRGVLTLDVPRGTRVADVLEHFALGPRRRIIVGVNGEAARTDQELVEGARIDLLTPLAGGSTQTRS